MKNLKTFKIKIIIINNSNLNFNKIKLIANNKMDFKHKIINLDKINMIIYLNKANKINLIISLSNKYFKIIKISVKYFKIKE